MKPTVSSATESMKPGLARVTRMPCAEAAPTSMFRMSTAQRTKAASSGSRAKIAAEPSVMRSETMTSQPWASPISSLAPSVPPLSFSRTSPSCRRRPRASSP